jgi:hypothetical protein
LSLSGGHSLTVNTVNHATTLKARAQANRAENEKHRSEKSDGGVGGLPSDATVSGGVAIEGEASVGGGANDGGECETSVGVETTMDDGGDALSPSSSSSASHPNNESSKHALQQTAPPLLTGTPPPNAVLASLAAYIEGDMELGLTIADYI